MCKYASTLNNTKHSEIVGRDIGKCPRVLSYLPLLGTENWGFNFILHSSGFTCDNDNRDSLRFVGNGQNNDDQAEANRQLVKLSNSLIVKFANRWLSKLKDVKYLAKAKFPIDHPNAKLAEYYKQLEDYWVQQFESWKLIQVGCELITAENRSKPPYKSPVTLP